MIITPTKTTIAEIIAPITNAIKFATFPANGMISITDMIGPKTIINPNVKAAHARIRIKVLLPFSLFFNVSTSSDFS